MQLAIFVYGTALNRLALPFYGFVGTDDATYQVSCAALVRSFSHAAVLLYLTSSSPRLLTCSVTRIFSTGLKVCWLILLNRSPVSLAV